MDLDTTGGISDATSGLGGINLSSDQTDAAKQDLGDAQKGLSDLNQRQAQSADQQPDAQAPPQRQPGLMDRMAPLLLISAFGGKAMKLSASNMIGATTGAMRGYLAGDEQAYQDAQKQYAEQLRAMKEHQDQQDKIYQQMRQAYKDRIDGDVKALQFARQVTGDESKNNSHVMDIEARLKEMTEKLNQSHTQFEENQTRLRAKDKGDTGGASGLPADWTKEKIDYYAKRQIAGDTGWRVGLSRTKSGVAILQAIDARVPEISKERGNTPTKDASMVAERKSVEHALTQRQAYVAASNQFVTNFQKQADLVEKYAGAGVAGGLTIINKWIQAGRKATGDPEVRRFDTAIRGLAREHQRIVTGGVASNTQLHASAQETADQLLNSSFTLDDVNATLGVMREEATNARDSGMREVSSLTTQLEQLGADVPADSSPVAPYSDAEKERRYQEWKKSRGR